MAFNRAAHNKPSLIRDLLRDQRPAIPALQLDTEEEPVHHGGADVAIQACENLNKIMNKLTDLRFLAAIEALDVAMFDGWSVSTSFKEFSML